MATTCCRTGQYGFNKLLMGAPKLLVHPLTRFGLALGDSCHQESQSDYRPPGQTPRVNALLVVNYTMCSSELFVCFFMLGRVAAMNVPNSFLILKAFLLSTI